MLPDIGRLRAAQGRFRALRLIHTNEQECLDATSSLDLCAPPRPRAARQLGRRRGPRTMQLRRTTSPPPEGDSFDYRGGAAPASARRAEANFGGLMTALEAEFAPRAGRTPSRRRRPRDLVHAPKNRSPRASSMRKDPPGASSASWRGPPRRVVDRVLQRPGPHRPALRRRPRQLDELLLRSAELDAETLIYRPRAHPFAGPLRSPTTPTSRSSTAPAHPRHLAQHAESSERQAPGRVASSSTRSPARQKDRRPLAPTGASAAAAGRDEARNRPPRAKERVAFLEKQLERTSRQRAERRRRRGQKRHPGRRPRRYTQRRQEHAPNAPHRLRHLSRTNSAHPRTPAPGECASPTAATSS